MFYRLKQLILITADLLMLILGLFLGITVRSWSWSMNSLEGFVTPMTWLFTLAIIILFVIGLYDVGRARNSVKFFQKIGLSAGVWFSFAVFFFYSYPNVTISPKTTLFLITLFGFGGIALWRALYNKFISTNLLRTPVAFVGFNEETKQLVEMIKKFPEHGYSLFGIVSSDPGADAHSIAELIQKNHNQHPGLVIISENAVNPAILNELYKELYNQVSIVNLADFYESFFERIPPFTFSEDWFITNLNEQNRKIYDRFKIIIDYFFALVMGAVFIITLPFVALGIKLSSTGPIFFTQKRVGRMGKEFSILKYRTMRVLGEDGSAEKSGPQFASINDNRITFIGKFMRRTRLDELPQFWNILRGEMSLIGPRPERPEFVKILSQQMPFYNLRHLIKPGLTGWAQLQASYFGTIEENLNKLEYDLYYLKNRNLILDTTIVLKTFSILLRFMGR